MVVRHRPHRASLLTQSTRRSSGGLHVYKPSGAHLTEDSSLVLNHVALFCFKRGEGELSITGQPVRSILFYFFLFLGTIRLKCVGRKTNKAGNSALEIRVIDLDCFCRQGAEAHSH